MTGGDHNDLVQEGLIGLTKAIRDYRNDREASFRSFAELCIGRQIITAIKTASRQKHGPLNSYLSLSGAPNSSDDGECSLGDILPSSYAERPDVQIMANEERGALIEMMKRLLSDMEKDILLLYLEGFSYESIADELGIDTKGVDNALQRVKRKVSLHLEARKSLESLLPKLPNTPRQVTSVDDTTKLQVTDSIPTVSPLSPEVKRSDIVISSDLYRLILDTKAGGIPYRILKVRTERNSKLDDWLDSLQDKGLIALVAGHCREEDIYVSNVYFDD